MFNALKYPDFIRLQKICVCISLNIIVVDKTFAYLIVIIWVVQKVG